MANRASLMPLERLCLSAECPLAQRLPRRAQDETRARRGHGQLTGQAGPGGQQPHGDAPAIAVTPVPSADTCNPTTTLFASPAMPLWLAHLDSLESKFPLRDKHFRVPTRGVRSPQVTIRARRLSSHI
jgi:hypothetical protein